MNIKKYFRPKNYIKFIKNKFERGEVSYSQCAEDIITCRILKALGIEKPTYIDIGANHPTQINNTYFFYKNGAKGICIEPDPILLKQIKKKRPRDVCLNIGIGAESENLADFYVMSMRVLSTFSKEEADSLTRTTDKKIEKVIKIPLVPMETIIKKYLGNKVPNFVSLDTEGYDFEILKSLDFQKFRPEIFCIETLTYAEDKTEKKKTEIIEFMIDKGYFPCADTYVNTIFVDKIKWLNR